MIVLLSTVAGLSDPIIRIGILRHERQLGHLFYAGGNAEILWFVGCFCPAGEAQEHCENADGCGAIRFGFGHDTEGVVAGSYGGNFANLEGLLSADRRQE